MAIKITKTTNNRRFDQGVSYSISAIDVNDQITTSAENQLVTGQLVDIAGNTGTTPDINGLGQAITVVDASNFTIDGVDITVAGNADGTVTRYNQSFATDLTYLEYLYEEVGGTVTVKSQGKVIHKNIPLSEFQDNAGAGFATFAAFLTYVA